MEYDTYTIVIDTQVQGSDDDVFPSISPLDKGDGTSKKHISEDENYVDPGLGPQVSLLAYSVAIFPLIFRIDSNVISMTERQRNGENVCCGEPQEREDVQKLKGEIRAQRRLLPGTISAQ